MLREAVTALLAALSDLFRSRGALLAENTLLRQQVILLHRAAPHPRLKARDRFTIGAITKLFPSLVAAVPIVRHDSVIRWHRSLWTYLLAPVFTNKALISSYFPAVAADKAVAPSFALALTSAPLASSACTTSRWPFFDA